MRKEIAICDLCGEQYENEKCNLINSYKVKTSWAPNLIEGTVFNTVIFNKELCISCGNKLALTIDRAIEEFIEENENNRQRDN